MRITVKLAFHEEGAVRLLNWLAQENARILRARPELPLLYDSRVVYRREKHEAWCDVINMLAQGKEDCDGLAAARAGELLARGYRALRQSEPGFKIARNLRLKSIPAEVLLKTNSEPDSPGLYHCVVRYRIAGKWYRDDPSARLGMNGPVDLKVKARWAAANPTKTWRTV